MENFELKLQLEEKRRESSSVKKLKDLCFKQREEIKSLKSVVLYPNTTYFQVQELNQAREIIHNLQKQVISLNGQVQYIAQDLVEVKTNTYVTESCYWQTHTSPYKLLELSLGSSDGLALEDLNPCLTPYIKTKPKEFERMESAEESLPGKNNVTTTRSKVRLHSKNVKLSQSSKGKIRRRSEDSKAWNGSENV